MNQRSRTANVSINMIAGLICQFVSLIANFISRTVLIRILGADYLGVNGLFTNILTILSFAELGIGNAIVFSMYKPLATRDKEKLASLMQLYKKAYRTIGFVIAAVGMLITPFLHYVIKEAPRVSENISILYLLFLLNTVSSYFFVYKKSIIIADQKNYIILLLTEGVHITQIVAQTTFLCLTHNFVIYLIIQISFTVVENIIASAIANRLYTFLKDKAAPLAKEESKRIFRNVQALAVYKFGSVILNGTDNILISAMIGVTEVGLVSNYVLIINAVTTILGKITDAFTASVGNLNASEQDKKQYEVFQKIFFISVWIYGYASVGLITVFNPFIEAWIGREYQLGTLAVSAIVAEFFVKGVHNAAYTYRTTLGYFVQGKYSAAAAAIINIGLSVLLCKWIGLAGIFIATPISRIITTGIVDPVLIYRNSFRKNPILYYANYVKYLLLIIFIGLLCNWILGFVNLGGWLGVLCRAGIVTIIFNGIMLVVFGRTTIFSELMNSLKNLRNKSE